MTAIAPMSDVATAVARYAQRFHAACGSGHHVASPIGAWLLLAVCASASTGRTRDDLADILGMDADAAAAVADHLIDEPHALVRLASGAWNRPVGEVPAFTNWLEALPLRVNTGDIPSQEYLDDWAELHTGGLIDRFPVEVDPDTLVLLATAIATTVSWELPFDVVSAAELGSGPWADRLSQVLRTPAGWGHQQFIASTDTAGDVAVHTATAQDLGHEGHYQPLLVTSVIGAPDVAPATILAEAHRIARSVAVGGPDAAQRSLFDLPLGDAPLWTITEAMANVMDGREERCVAVLPAWTARSDHDLTGADVGMLTAARALAQLLGMPEFRFDAKQSAVATYDRTGFEAAAVTAMAVRAGGVALPKPGLLRTATLRFGHPYAVVATTAHHSPDERIDQPVTTAWHGLPIFSAWITEPTSA